MNAQAHLKDLCGFLRRRAELPAAEREGVIPEYWTGAAKHIEALMADNTSLKKLCDEQAAALQWAKEIIQERRPVPSGETGPA